MLKKQMVYEELFKNSPLVVLNNFSGEGMQLKLIASMFQNMFPTINLTTVNLKCNTILVHVSQIVLSYYKETFL